MSVAKQQRKKRSALRVTLLAVCAAVFVFSAWRLLAYYFEYRDMSETYAVINDRVLEKDFSFDTDDEGHLTDVPGLDFETLKEINPEVLGYIMIPGTSISYPFARSGDPYKYLNCDITGAPSRGGAIFMDFENDPSFTDDNTIIYGHNLFDGSMFGQLQSYISGDRGFFDNHRYIYVYLEDEVRLYRVFCAMTTEDGSEVYNINFPKHEMMLEQNLTEYGRSVHKAEPLPDDYDSTITLSTCSDGRETDRTVVLAYFAGLVSDN